MCRPQGGGLNGAGLALGVVCLQNTLSLHAIPLIVVLDDAC